MRDQPDQLRVSDLMSATVYSINPRDSVEMAYELMNEHHLRHVTVIDDEGDLLGIVSHRDLLRHSLIERGDLPLTLQHDLLRSSRIEEFMTSEVETTEPEQSIHEAAQVMFENKFGCLPVVEGQRLVGILTEADFVRYFARQAH